MLVDAAWDVSPEAEIVQVAQRAASRLGMSSELAGVPFGSDASKLGRAGIPTIIYGPGNIDQAHGEVEYVELEQLRRAKDFYKECIIDFFKL